MDDDDDQLPDDKNLEYDDDTMELTLPSGAFVVGTCRVPVQSDAHSERLIVFPPHF